MAGEERDEYLLAFNQRKCSLQPDRLLSASDRRETSRSPVLCYAAARAPPSSANGLKSTPGEVCLCLDFPPPRFSWPHPPRVHLEKTVAE